MARVTRSQQRSIEREAPVTRTRARPRKESGFSAARPGPESPPETEPVHASTARRTRALPRKDSAFSKGPPEFELVHDETAISDTASSTGAPGDKSDIATSPADERLVLAAIFLSEEDSFTSAAFEERLTAIEELIVKEYAARNVPCDYELYTRVKNMVRLHKSRLEEEKNPPAKPTARPRFYSRRLPSQARASVRMAQKETQRADHPPFTLSYDEHTAEFISEINGTTKRSEELMDIEYAGYAEALGKPESLVIPLDGAEDTFEGRAKKRGRKRAALQLAMHMMASNEEQHFRTDWNRRVVTLPQPVQPQRIDEMFTSLPSLEWTAKAAEIAREQKALPMLERLVQLTELVHSVIYHCGLLDALPAWLSRKPIETSAGWALEPMFYRGFDDFGQRLAVRTVTLPESFTFETKLATIDEYHQLESIRERDATSTTAIARAENQDRTDLPPLTDDEISELTAYSEQLIDAVKKLVKQVREMEDVLADDGRSFNVFRFLNRPRAAERTALDIFRAIASDYSAGGCNQRFGELQARALAEYRRLLSKHRAHVIRLIIEPQKMQIKLGGNLPSDPLAFIQPLSQTVDELDRHSGTLAAIPDGPAKERKAAELLREKIIQEASQPPLIDHGSVWKFAKDMKVKGREAKKGFSVDDVPDDPTPQPSPTMEASHFGFGLSPSQPDAEGDMDTLPAPSHSSGSKVNQKNPSSAYYDAVLASMSQAEKDKATEQTAEATVQRQPKRRKVVRVNDVPAVMAEGSRGRKKKLKGGSGGPAPTGGSESDAGEPKAAAGGGGDDGVKPVPPAAWGTAPPPRGAERQDEFWADIWNYDGEVWHSKAAPFFPFADTIYAGNVRSADMRADLGRGS